MPEVLFLRNIEIDGVPGLDLRIEDGSVAEIGPRLAGRGESLDGRGGALIPGFHDHHIHILATAARSSSLDVTPIRDRALFETLARGYALRLRGEDWLRVTGYHESQLGPLDLAELDRLFPDAPVRIEHQTGALWFVNSRGLARLDLTDAPAGVERDATGRPTGRIVRENAWLRLRTSGSFPRLSDLGAQLAAFGLTGLTDATVSTEQAAADYLFEARQRGAMPQRMVLMSGEPLISPGDGVEIGPRKFLLDDHTLPDIDQTIEVVNGLRSENRAAAAHCVTDIQLAYMLAVFDAVGGRRGDRIEHGSVIPRSAIGRLSEFELTVVTQPAFVAERGDRYLQDHPPEVLDDLYRCASLLEHGVRVAAGSDAPYGNPDPWLAMRAAATRLTRDGAVLGPGERVDAARALGLYLCGAHDPGGPMRRVTPGAPADLCLLGAPMMEILEALDADLVRATMVAGQLVYLRD